MTTQKKLLANRQNALKSRGATSAAGRARSSQNALKSGIYAQSMVTRFENPAELETLRDEYMREYCPESPQERDCVDMLIRNSWFLRRLDAQEAEIYNHNFHGDPYRFSVEPYVQNEQILNRLGRRRSQLQRDYRDALRELQSLQADRQQREEEAREEEAREEEVPEPIQISTKISTNQPEEIKTTSPENGFVSSNGYSPALSCQSPTLAGEASPGPAILNAPPSQPATAPAEHIVLGY